MHEQAVYRGCLRWLDGNREDADEAYARSAMRALRHCPRHFRDDEHAKAWLLTVARNVCMDLHRERSRDRKVIAEDEVLASEYALVTGDPEVAFLARERQQRALHALAQLPRRLRRTAELHFLSDMRYGDIARELGISPQNVRKRMQHVRDLLRHPPIAPPVEPAPSHPHRTLCCAVVTTAEGTERDAEVVVGLRVARRDGRRFAMLERYIARHPGGWRKRLELARMLTIGGRWTEAAEQYRQVVEKHPYAPDPWVELGEILSALGCADAAHTYEKAARVAGRDAQRLHFRALAALARGEAKRAGELLAAALDADPLHAPSLRAWGVLHLAAGRPFDAACLLQRSLDADPDHPLTPSLLCDALLAAGRPVTARATIEEALARDRTNVPALERLLAIRVCARLVDGEEGRRTDAVLARLERLAPQRIGTATAAARLMRARSDQGGRKAGST